LTTGTAIPNAKTPVTLLTWKKIGFGRNIKEDSQLWGRRHSLGATRSFSLLLNPHSHVGIAREVQIAGSACKKIVLQAVARIEHV
jgi:hypothetical protein